MKRVVICLLLLNLWLAACTSLQQNVPNAESTPDAAEKMSGNDTSKSNNDFLPTVVPFVATVDPLNDPNTILAKRSVYYPPNVLVVQDADKPIVLAHAAYLRDHADRKVRLEGNCDERGSAEYNLALGQRRADGVKKWLLFGGARESQVEAISFGQEKQKATGHDAASWAQNRRTDLNYEVR